MFNLNSKLSLRTAQIEQAHNEALARREQIVAAAKAKAEQGLHAALAKEDAALAELATARDKLCALTSQRDALAEVIRLGEIQVAQQTALAAQFSVAIAAEFGVGFCGGNSYPTTFGKIAENDQAAFVAQFVLPPLSAWLDQKRADLGNVDARLAELMT